MSERLDPQTVEQVVRRAATKAMVRDGAKMRGHRLRSGGASDYYDGGADLLAIQRQGRWGERSTVVYCYIQGIDRKKRNPLMVARFDNEDGQ